MDELVYNFLTSLPTFLCLLDKSPVADTAVVNARVIRLDVWRLMALIAASFTLVVWGRECSVLPFSMNSDYTTGEEPICDLVCANEGLKREDVCVVLRLNSPRMCVWSTLCVLRVVLFTIFSRDLVSHILPSQTLNLGPQKHQRLVLKNSQFPSLHHVSFPFGICLFSQPLTCWWSLSNMDNKTTDCAA